MSWQLAYLVPMRSNLIFCLLFSLATTWAAGCGSDGPADGPIKDRDRINDGGGSAREAGVATEVRPSDVVIDWPADVALDAPMTDGIADGSFGAIDLVAADTSVGITDASRIDGAAAAADTGCAGWTTLQRISPAAAVELMAALDPIVINVHIPYEGHIPGTDTSIPYDDVDAIDAYLHQDHCAQILLVCKSGSMSKSAGDQLVKRGYLRVRDLTGGMVAWQASGYPLLKDGGT